MRTPDRRRGSRAATAMVIAVACALGIGALLRGDRSNTARTAQVAREPAPVAGVRARDSARRAVPAVVVQRLDDGDPAAAGALAHFEAAAAYPPTSRPLTRDRHTDLIEWNTRHEYPRDAVIDPRAKVLFSADRYWVVGTAPVAAYLLVERDGRPVPARILEAHATADGERIPLPLAWNGQLHAVELVFADAFPAAERATRVRFEVAFELEDGAPPERAAINFLYNPAGNVPARFTGAFRDAVVDGSLVVYAEVEVVRAGWFNLDANLWDDHDEPVAFSRFKGELPAGVTWVPLQFFGKVLVDAGRPSPYRVRELRGVRVDPDYAPSLEMMEPFAGAYQTQRYELAAFSADEWRSPRKDETSRALAAGAPSGAR